MPPRKDETFLAVFGTDVDIGSVSGSASKCGGSALFGGLGRRRTVHGEETGDRERRRARVILRVRELSDDSASVESYGVRRGVRYSSDWIGQDAATGDSDDAYWG